MLRIKVIKTNAHPDPETNIRVSKHLLFLFHNKNVHCTYCTSSLGKIYEVTLHKNGSRLFGHTVL